MNLNMMLGDMEEKAKYILTENQETIERIKKAIEKKKEKYGEGYCPCVPPKKHGIDTICPCKEYRETGTCHCGLYKE